MSDSWLLAPKKAPAFGRVNLRRVKTKWPWWPSNSTLRLLLAGHRAESNIAPVMTALELNERYGFISARARGNDGRSQRGYRQNPSACCRHFVICDLCSGVKNLNRFELRRLIQTGDRFSGFVFPRITGRGEDDCHGRAFVPVDRVIVELAVDRGFQQRQKIGFHSRQERLRFRVPKSAIELEHAHAVARNHQSGIQ